ncbi:MAG: NapC/NirT family cytochrome c [Anaerolineae bacterium]|nr:NapC/NirT family cytochrome c [Anaerolineae bacterium]
MRKLFSAIKHFLLPPPGSSIWVRLLPFVVLGMITIVFIYGSVEAWTYTNSSEFCGTTCHTMPPEYSAYQRSPHARVQCVECHIGRDVVTTQFTRKAGDLRHVVLTITQDYEFPIHSRAMRPARDTCEKCHFPEKFSDDSLREIYHFAENEENTPENTYLILKTGGGASREGLGQGIHWHIENEVYYLATDALEQDIPYVRVVAQNGDIREYYDISSGFTPDDVAGTTLARMDCLNCHNRITHNIPNPADAIDEAMHKNLIARDLPHVRQQAFAVLSAEYESDEAAYAGIASLEDYYAETYPDVYAARVDEIQAAVATLQEIYSQSVFREQKIDWGTHPNNLGHKDDPGCFRCHDGKHLTGSGEAIRLECNLCHSIPAQVDNAALVTTIELPRGPEPPSHTHSSWITLHGKAIDSSCAACHVPTDPSVDYTTLTEKPPVDGSFCGNSACHANEWEHAGFDADELQPVLERQLYILLHTSPYLLEGVPRTYEGTFRAMFNGRCTYCHSGPTAEAGLDLSSYATILQGGTNGPALVPGDPDASLIIQKQSGTRDHFGQVLDDELEELTEWIATGAPEK